MKSLSCILLLTSLSQAATIANFSLDTNDRFTVPPTASDFIGDGYDWSGVGRVTAGSNTNKWATLIGDNYFLTASHFAPVAGDSVSFVSNDLSQTFSYNVGGQIAVFGDLQLGYFTSNADISLKRYDYNTIAANSIADTGLAGQTLLSIANGSSVGTTIQQVVSQNQLESYINGGESTFAAPDVTITLEDPSGMPAPIGFDNLILFQNELGDTDHTLEQHEFLLQSGDSGSPLFSTASGELVIQGIAFAILEDIEADFVETGDSTLEMRDATFYSYTGSYASQIASAISSVPAAIPEPSTLLLSAMSLTGLLVYRKRA